MIISEDPKFILFSVNKAGTSSMDDALASYFDEARCRENLSKDRAIQSGAGDAEKKIREGLSEMPWNAITKLKHSSPEWILEHWDNICPGTQWAEFYKVCFVRNPFDRLLSIYSYHTQVLPHTFPKAAKAGSFAAWLSKGGTGAAKKSIKRFVQDREGEPMLDFIGRYETLQKDWDAFLSHVGIPGIELGRNPATATSHEKWPDVFTPELKEIVMDNPVWRDDLEYFGYL